MRKFELLPEPTWTPRIDIGHEYQSLESKTLQSASLSTLNESLPNLLAHIFRWSSIEKTKLTNPVDVFPFPTPGTIVENDRGAISNIDGRMIDALETRGVERAAEVTTVRRKEAMVAILTCFLLAELANWSATARVCPTLLTEMETCQVDCVTSLEPKKNTTGKKTRNTSQLMKKEEA